MTDKRHRLLLLFGIVTLGAALPVAASNETGACLACHADKGHEIAFPQGGRIEAYVDATQFKASVHGFLACTDCHERELLASGHEHRRFRSEELFKVRYSRICRGCHSDEEIGATAVHVSLLEQEREGHAPICTDCHPAHSVMPSAGGKILAGEEKHCLECHAAQAPQMAPPVVHGNLSCSGCHVGYSMQAHPGGGSLAVEGGVEVAAADLCRRCHFDKYTKSLEGIHYDQLSRGADDAPDCIDCHGSHQIAPLAHDRAQSAAKCRECHPRLYEIYSASVHGDAMVNAQNRDVPICSDCHRAHDIGDPLTVDYRDDIPFMCSNCHASEAIAGKYGLSTDVVKSYLSDFHGSTVSILREQGAGVHRPERPVAVCTDCHGTHDIKSMASMGTGEVKAQLLEKCRQCHEGASDDFPDAWLSHYIPSMATAPLLFIVNRIYAVVLPLLALGILLQVLLHTWWRATGGAGAARLVRAAGDSDRIRRFAVTRVVEHLVLVLLFLGLAVTGLAQKFHAADVSQWLFAAFDGIDRIRRFHHYAGLALVALLATHVAINALGFAVRGWRLSMLVSWQDLRDVAHNIRYYLGLERQPAACDRYDYKQKFTYWLVLAGGLIMVLTGLVLWFPVAAARYLPGEGIALAAMLHSHQALVIILLVAVWHVYDSVFSPDVFPLDTSMLTGRMTRARMRRLHPRELEERSRAGQAGPGRDRRPRHTRP